MHESGISNTTTYNDGRFFKALGAPFVFIYSFFFSFKKFHLWRIAVIAHFVIQITVFMGIVSLGEYQIMGMKLNFFGTDSKLLLCILSFVTIRIGFELVLVILGIHDKLATIADSLEKIEKCTKQ